MAANSEDGVSVDALIESQRQFYDLRAPDFGDETVPDRRVSGAMARDVARDLVDEFAPTGHVLELACGTGAFTCELLRHARTVTAVDGSPRMLERNRREVNDTRITYVHADVFKWRPDRQYDNVFFGFWLSHVPPSAFDGFWDLVRSSLRPGGRVAFVDEDDRGTTNDEIHLVGKVPVATRTLRDGRQLDIVKVYWDPDRLEVRIRSIGWQVAVQRVGETFLYGSGTWSTGLA